MPSLPPLPRARAILFDSIGCLTQPEYRNDGLLFHHFGTQAPNDKAAERWTTVYYLHENMAAAERVYKAILDKQAKVKKMTQIQSEKCKLRREARRPRPFRHGHRHTICHGATE